jgi:membrane-bound serine protease (ClpP class)
VTGRGPAGALLAVAVLAGAVGARAAEPALARIVIDGSINPAVAEYVHEAIAHASAEGRTALVIQLDTPGGLLQSAHTW